MKTKFKIKNIYNQTKVFNGFPVHIKLLVALIICVVPIAAIGTEKNPVPFKQTFILTAYYSPLPGQCCYVKGGLEADKYLNGKGVQGADGTPVYPGMLAAPPSYGFGTVIDLPGLGVLSVHDRGGAIQELDDGIHRLDVWAGYGEEGLARALAFGVQTIEGMVYPDGTAQPEEKIDLADLPAPISRLEEFLVHGGNLMAMRAKEGQTGLTVKLIQDSLREAGYFNAKSTGFYGEDTRLALTNFINDFEIDADASNLNESTAAYLLAAVRRKGDKLPLAGYVEEGSSKRQISESQRLLRYLGYYKGRTNGIYDQKLFQAIMKFQQDQNLVGDETSPGAGRIGPKTSKALELAWNKRRIKSQAGVYLVINKVDEKLINKGEMFDEYLSEGYSGKEVKQLQNFLVDKGFFPKDEINGNFGPLTKESVIKYQKDKKIIKSNSSAGAGTVGPLTLQNLRRDIRSEAYWKVRAEGWQVL